MTLEAKEKRERLEAEERARREKLEADEKLERARMEHELEMQKVRTANQGNVTSNKAKMPRLPTFVDGKDELDAYLDRFERYATTQNWPKADWATSLSALLTGKALGVYSRLSLEEGTDYDQVKQALLTRYQLTEEGFKFKFREGLPEEGESPGQFITRITSYLARWMEAAKIPATFEGLRRLIVMEQYISKCSKDLAAHLKRGSYEDLSAVAEASLKYLESIGKTLASNQPRTEEKKQHNVKSFQSSSGKVSDKRDTDKVCHNCHKSGHLRLKCRQKGGGDEKRCTSCGFYGHEASFCRRNTKQLAGSAVAEQEQVEVSALCHGSSFEDSISNVSMNLDFSLQEGKKECIMLSWDRNDKVDKVLKVVEGKVNDQVVQTLRDSGCSTICVNKDLVRAEQLTGEQCTCMFLNGIKTRVPVALVDVDTPYLEGKGMKALCLESPAFDLVIGDVVGARCKCDPNPQWKVEKVNSVTTRAQSKTGNKLLKPLKVTIDNSEVEVTPEVLKDLQNKDGSLEKVRNSNKILERGNHKSWYTMDKGIWYRMYQPDVGNPDKVVKQVVVPQQLRLQVMSLAHDSLMGGHLGIRKTYDKVTTSFYWPGIHGDVTRFCQSCDVCQKTVSKGKVTRVPLEKVPLIDQPFKRVAVDLVGKIYPPTESGNRYILTLVDTATRYPEAVPLKEISTEAVSEGLVSMYSRLGVPQEVLSDQGSQFMSELMQEVSRLLSIKRLVSTPYHPICNGLCEKFNGSLKKMLKRLCEKMPRSWDRYLDAALFAYREAPQESTGFSPFELLFGRTVRGPVQILKELWTKEFDVPDIKTSYQYVVELRERIEEGLALAQEALSQSQTRYKKYYDKKAKARKFEVGNQVLMLLPTDSNKLLMQWKGPYKIEQVVSVNDYKVNIDGKLKTYHANMLKKYFTRDEQPTQVGASVLQVICAAIVESSECTSEDTVDDEALLELEYVGGKETYKDVEVSSGLTSEQEQQLRDKVSEFKDIFTETPGLTNLVQHSIPLTTNTPVQSRPYAIPYNCRESLKKDVDEMLELGIIERSDNTPYTSPVVVVRKRDGSNRVCIDYRKINRASILDPEPTAVAEDIFALVSKAKYLSTIDLSKGYWQIPMAPEDIMKTGFVTPDGTFVMVRMPFGLKNSSATFNKMMRKLLHGLANVTSYIDDILVYTETWEEHLEILGKVFQRIKQANLHIRPSKCMMGSSKVDYLGHHVGDGEIGLQEYNVKKIVNAKQPVTKKEVRSFLGLTGYYRNYLPNYSTVAAPLTDLTKKGSPNKVVWGEPQERAFVHLKKHLTSKPVLKLPDMTRPFVLRTDASDVGVGAVLMQQHDEELFPVAFASRKLSQRERAYSTMERECLALVWGVQKFQLYLYGREFVLQTDHQPLVYLNRCKVSNSRIMRWALFLQSYAIQIEAIKGSLNVGADYMSRIN